PYLAAGWVGGARAEAPAARPRSDPRRSDARPAPPAPTPTPGPEERNPAAPTTAAHQPAAEVAHLVAPTTSHGRMGEPMNARIAGGVMAAAEIRRLIEQRSRAPHTCAVKNCTVGDCGHCV
ncbi:MAG: hypothetical protein HY719_12355, partial [Planctomycetes bacterium]|nr:hypothetical protein [Planctomycetota bacterium]